MITCYTIIVNDLNLLRWCIDNARARAGIDHEWLVIIADEKPHIIEWCKQSNVRFYVHEEHAEEEIPDKTERFLRNLYECWNLGYEKAQTEWVARMGSDQFFSYQWLRNLHDAHPKQDSIMHTWTVESPVAIRSRHEIQHFGDSMETFDKKRWDMYCRDMQKRYMHTRVMQATDHPIYRHPARGIQRRPDGVTWLQKKSLWEKFGPLSHVVNGEGVTGDVSYMDAMYDAGIPGHLVPTSLSYHYVRGESRDVQQ